MLTGLSMVSYALFCVPLYHVAWPRYSQGVCTRCVSLTTACVLTSCLQSQGTAPSSPLTLHELHVADCLLLSSHWSYSRADITLLDTVSLCLSIDGLPSSCMTAAWRAVTLRRPLWYAVMLLRGVVFPRSRSWLGYVYLESLEAMWIPVTTDTVHQDDSVASQLSDTRSVGAVQLCCPQAPLHRAQLCSDLGSLQLANTMFSKRKAIFCSGRCCTISLSTYSVSENQSAKPCVLSLAH
jgi:hypothetical protein